MIFSIIINLFYLPILMLNVNKRFFKLFTNKYLKLPTFFLWNPADKTHWTIMVVWNQTEFQKNNKIWWKGIKDPPNGNTISPIYQGCIKWTFPTYLKTRVFLFLKFYQMKSQFLVVMWTTTTRQVSRVELIDQIQFGNTFIDYLLTE